MTRKPKISRRQLLHGAGGFTLALPFLPSLLPRGADARNSPLAEPRFVSICTQHGAVWQDSMLPGDETLTETMNYAGHEIRRGDLVRSDEGGGVAALSGILRGASDKLTDSVVSKMNVMRGLDIPFYIGHHRGGHLGNWAANDGNGEDGQVQQGNPTPTIDQILGYSNRFYSDLSGTLERVMAIGHTQSYGWSNPQAQSGEIQETATHYSSLALFNRIFVPEEEENDPRPPVVDRVMANYNSLRESDRRLSADDRRRLDEHVQRIDELQRRLAVAVSCGEIPVPTQDSQDIRNDPSYHLRPDLNAEFWQLFNDVIVAAFLCGTSRIAVLGITDHFSEYSGDWHQDVAHQAHLPDGVRQAEIAAGNRRNFEGVMLDLLAKLDIDEGDGTTVLDNSLVQWTQESGPTTHESVDTVVVTGGGASGCLRTGQYLDYRNTTSLFSEEHYQDTPVRLYPGLLYQQHLATALMAMGMEPEDYEIEAGGGYPELFVGEGRDVHYPNSVLNARGDFLPWLRDA